LDLYSRTKIPVRQLAREHGIARSTIYLWRALKRQTDSLQRSPNRGGRRAKLDEQARQSLREVLRAGKALSLGALCAELQRSCGVRVHRATLSRTLRRMGLYLWSEQRAVSPPSSPPSEDDSPAT
jgi:transposase